MFHIVARTVVLTSTKWAHMAYLAVLAKAVTFAMQPSTTPSRDGSMLQRSPAFLSQMAAIGHTARGQME